MFGKICKNCGLKTINFLHGYKLPKMIFFFFLKKKYQKGLNFDVNDILSF